LAKLPPGALAIPADPAQLELFSPLSGQLKEKLELPGKRKEVFKCVIDRSYFPKKDPPKTDPPPTDTPDQPELPKPSVMHEKPALIHEQSDTHRSQTMPLTDQDWMIIDDIFSRIAPFNESSRDAFLNRIAKTPAQKNEIATKISYILDYQDFYVALQAFVRSSEDEGLEQRTLHSMLKYVNDEKDKTVLQRLIQERFAGPQNPDQVPLQPPPQPPPQDRYAPADFKKQCQALFIAKQWPELLDLLAQRTKQMGSTRSAQNLQGAVVIFRSDYESIRSQSRDGQVSTDEEQRLRVALWSRVSMLIDDIEGNLKL
jgi:hypothetical protein